MPVWIKLNDLVTNKGFTLYVPSIIVMEWVEKTDELEAHTSISTARGDILVAETPEQIELMVLYETREAIRRCAREYFK